MPRNNPIPTSELIGKRYGFLVITREAERHERRLPRDRNFICQCDCGAVYLAGAYVLLKGLVKSCGCQQEVRRHKHGHTTLTTQSRAYVIWNSMRQRVSNPKASNYHNYGGRGITMDERWNDFSNFLNDMGEPPSDGHTLDRKENDLGYSKDNCSWELWSRQMRHTRQNRLITFKDQTKCAIEWAEETGIPHAVILWRSRAGWSAERILTTLHFPRIVKPVTL